MFLSRMRQRKPNWGKTTDEKGDFCIWRHFLALGKCDANCCTDLALSKTQKRCFKQSSNLLSAEEMQAIFFWKISLTNMLTTDISTKKLQKEL